MGLLLVDEVGFQPMTRHEASLLFRMVSCRDGRGSSLITTNMAVKDRPEIPPEDEVMATALLHRPLHDCHVISIKGRSYRVRGFERMLEWSRASGTVLLPVTSQQRTR